MIPLNSSKLSIILPLGSNSEPPPKKFKTEISVLRLWLLVLGSRVRQTEFKSAPKVSNLDEQLTSVASTFHLLNGNKKYPPHGAIMVTEFGNTCETPSMVSGTQEVFNKY